MSGNGKPWIAEDCIAPACGAAMVYAPVSSPQAPPVLHTNKSQLYQQCSTNQAMCTSEATEDYDKLHAVLRFLRPEALQIKATPLIKMKAVLRLLRALPIKVIPFSSAILAAKLLSHVDRASGSNCESSKLYKARSVQHCLEPT